MTGTLYRIYISFQLAFRFQGPEPFKRPVGSLLRLCWGRINISVDAEFPTSNRQPSMLLILWLVCGLWQVLEAIDWSQLDMGNSTPTEIRDLQQVLNGFIEAGSIFL